MKKIIIVIFVVCTSSIYSQFDVSAGMGIQLVNNSSIRDYINFSNIGSDKLSDFNTNVLFLGEFTHPISNNIDLGIDYTYSIFSYNSSSGILGNYDLTYNSHMPSVVSYYVLTGTGYKFKFGGGIGPRIVNLKEKGITINEKNYSTLGFGLLLRLEAHTKLSDKFYASIMGGLRYDRPGEPENDGKFLINNVTNDRVNVNSFGIELTLGISYFF